MATFNGCAAHATGVGGARTQGCASRGAATAAAAGAAAECAAAAAAAARLVAASICASDNGSCGAACYFVGWAVNDYQAAAIAQHAPNIASSGGRQHVCTFVQEKERERESVCVCVCACVCMMCV